LPAVFSQNGLSTAGFYLSHMIEKDVDIIKNISENKNINNLKNFQKNVTKTPSELFY